MGSIVDNLGFPMGKDKMIVADLSGKVYPDRSTYPHPHQYAGTLGPDLLFPGRPGIAGPGL